MTHWLDLFTPDSWRRFCEHEDAVAGFPPKSSTAARKVEVGDLFICYMVRLSRFCGLLRVKSNVYSDRSPIFADANDPFTVRFKVELLVCLQTEAAIPIATPDVWGRLAWTRGREKSQRGGWSAYFRQTLRALPKDDGEFLVAQLMEQSTRPRIYPLTDADKRALDEHS
jgi:hypothetical protein